MEPKSTCLNNLNPGGGTTRGPLQPPPSGIGGGGSGAPFLSLGFLLSNYSFPGPQFCIQHIQTMQKSGGRDPGAGGGRESNNLNSGASPIFKVSTLFNSRPQLNTSNKNVNPRPPPTTKLQGFLQALVFLQQQSCKNVVNNCSLPTTKLQGFL